MFRIPLRHTSVSVGFCLFALLLGAWPCPALSHPHMFIKERVKALFAQDQLTGFSLEWRFDDLSTMGFLPQRNPSAGPLRPEEVAQLKKIAFDNLRGYGYFTHVRQGMRSISVNRSEHFTASLDGDRLVYRFSVYLASPLNVRHTPVVADFYDDTNYTALSFPENDSKAVTMSGNPAGCTIARHDEPGGVTITCN
ncbi:MAG TPA: DUF1007 family protein [Candidatus Baltobacteraceae bacterium]|jgi:ABC-type uncharacterized transport system substrate-binding protein|nr:DUF1007 family protein [Candidatus Baltobacteraceae bacterium]